MLDDPAFEQLVSDQQQALFAVLLARLRSRDDALDVLQDVLLKAWHRRRRLLALDANGQKRYLHVMARNAAIDHLRRRARVPGTAVLAHEPGTKTLAVDHRQELLDKAMAELADDERELLLLATVAELSSQEIGERVGRSAGTVRSQLARLRQRLQARIAGWLQQEASL